MFVTCKIVIKLITVCKRCFCVQFFCSHGFKALMFYEKTRGNFSQLHTKLTNTALSNVCYLSFIFIENNSRHNFCSPCFVFQLKWCKNNYVYPFHCLLHGIRRVQKKLNVRYPKMYVTFPFVPKNGASGDMSLRFKIRTERKVGNSNDKNRISLTQK